MKTPLFIILTSIIALLCGACGSTSENQVENDLRTAEDAIIRGDMKAAKSVANHLTDGENLTGLTPRQLGRLSIVYMQLADQADQADNVSAAIGCYRKAFAVDSDSATAYYNSVPGEHAMVLSALTHAIDNPADSLTFADEEPDSIDINANYE